MGYKTGTRRLVVPLTEREQKRVAKAANNDGRSMAQWAKIVVLNALKARA